MLKILQGDDTAANNRSIKIKLPDEDVGEGFEFVFEFCGVARRDAYVPGGTATFNYTRSETGMFPLGVSVGSLAIEKEGFRQTINSSIPIKVTDCADELEGAKNEVGLSVVINSGVPHVDKDELTKVSTNKELRELVNAILTAINSTGKRNENQ